MGRSPIIARRMGQRGVRLRELLWFCFSRPAEQKGEAIILNKKDVLTAIAALRNVMR